MIFNSHAFDLLIGHINDFISSRPVSICGLDFTFKVVPLCPNCPVAISVGYIDLEGNNVHIKTYTDFTDFLSVFEICLSHKDNISIFNTLKSVFS